LIKSLKDPLKFLFRSRLDILITLYLLFTVIGVKNKNWFVNSYLTKKLLLTVNDVMHYFQLHSNLICLTKHS